MKNLLSGILTFSLVASAGAIVHSHSEEVQEDLNCLAMNIYHEARGEPIIGQIGVAQVTMNRVDHWNWPDDVCEVVWQPYQFSWTNDGRSDTPRDQDRWEVAQNIAETVYMGEEDDPTEGAVFYHATWVNPDWSNYSSVTESWRYGVHIFYNWSGTW